ncbi:PREDICTED: uncharacterized protein LOC103915626 [Pygoscelis adeliae]|uniref:uncharacterized protein LOC103915626 n=1 Tax=Pygoscelis adeliae TaxID=9238 RepID=UPI0004F4DA39|nr:PREDICTED: uncharacterized protein LOC103915626 [Pygoscelis adeliae]
MRGIFHRFLPGSACCKSCGLSKVCKSPCPRQPDRGGTVALRSSQGRHLLSGSPGCGIWQGCHSLLLCGAKPFCSVILCTRLAAQQIQKTSAVTLDRSLRPAQRSRDAGRVAPLTSPCFTEGRCIQMLTTCRTHILPGGCSRVVEMQAMALAHPERCQAASAGRLTSLVSPAPMAVKGSPSVCCRCSCTSGTAVLREQTGSS